MKICTKQRQNSHRNQQHARQQMAPSERGPSESARKEGRGDETRSSIATTSRTKPDPETEDTTPVVAAAGPSRQRGCRAHHGVDSHG